jgi:hypothetical protein
MSTLQCPFSSSSVYIVIWTFVFVFFYLSLQLNNSSKKLSLEELTLTPMDKAYIDHIITVVEHHLKQNIDNHSCTFHFSSLLFIHLTRDKLLSLLFDTVETKLTFFSKFKCFRFGKDPTIGFVRCSPII